MLTDPFPVGIVGGDCFDDLRRVLPVPLDQDAELRVLLHVAVAELAQQRHRLAIIRLAAPLDEGGGDETASGPRGARTRAPADSRADNRRLRMRRSPPQRLRLQ